MCKDSSKRSDKSQDESPHTAVLVTDSSEAGGSLQGTDRKGSLDRTPVPGEGGALLGWPGRYAQLQRRPQ